MNAKKLYLTLILLCYGYCNAATLKITADYKHYDKFRDVLVAKGNVVVEGPGFRIESPYVIRYFKDEKILAMDKFEFEKEGYRVSGSSLEYYYWKNSGNAENVRINFGKTFFGARYMAMTKDKFEMSDAYFTGCNSSSSDYHFAAQHLSLYPGTGLVVAYYATCFVWIAPVIPVPTFVYSAPVPKSKFIKRPRISTRKTRAEEVDEGIKTTQPVPEIGSNTVDGNFIKQGFNWYFSPRTYAKTLISYSEKNRLGAGLATNYIMNNWNEGELRFGSNEGERFYWGLTHYISLGPKLTSDKEDDRQIYDFYKPGGKYSYELELKHSVRERINFDKNEAPFSRVSFTPKVTLRSNRKPIPYLSKEFTYFAEASFANVSEEVSEFETPSPEGYTVSSPRTNYFADITFVKDLGLLGDFKAVVDGSFSDYEKLGSWDNSRQQLYLTQQYFDKLTLEYGHVHYIMQRGFSPYLFEGYYYSPFDQFVGSVALKAWFSTFKLGVSYDIPSMGLYSAKYQWLFGLHCYNLVFDYTLRKEIDTYSGAFNFSFELVPSRW